MLQIVIEFLGKKKSHLTYHGNYILNCTIPIADIDQSACFGEVIPMAPVACGRRRSGNNDRP